MITTPSLRGPGGTDEERGLIAFTERGRAIIRPTTDGLAALPEWSEHLSESEQAAVMKATAAANVGDWYMALTTLEAAGFSAGIR